MGKKRRRVEVRQAEIIAEIGRQFEKLARAFVREGGVGLSQGAGEVSRKIFSLYVLRERRRLHAERIREKKARLAVYRAEMHACLAKFQSKVVESEEDKALRKARYERSLLVLAQERRDEENKKQQHLFVTAGVRSLRAELGIPGSEIEEIYSVCCG